MQQQHNTALVSLASVRAALLSLNTAVCLIYEYCVNHCWYKSKNSIVNSVGTGV